MRKIIAIVGPTTTGKSDLAVRLAKKFKGEIISADSRQVYKGLNIGTGKITKREMQGIPHYLLDVENPKNVFTVEQYKQHAIEKIKQIQERNKIPFLVGGTGFYIETLLDDATFPNVPPNIQLRKVLKKKSVQALQTILKKLDPKRFKTVDQKNPVRLIRSIEIAKSLGHVPKVQRVKNSNVLLIGVSLPDKDLKVKIEKRLQTRIKQGMIAEAKRLHQNGLSFKRMNELGLEYRYLAQFLKKEISKQELVEQLNKEIWKYAKRQKTWFKRDTRISWLHPSESKKIEKEIQKFLKT